MGLEEVKEILKEHVLDKNIYVFEESTATVSLAAKALGCDDDEIAKSMAFKLQDKTIMIITKGTARIDNRKFKDTFHCKAKMLSSQELIEDIGHPPGGVCPFAVKSEVDIYLDETLKSFDTVYPAAGTPNSAVKISVDKLKEITHGIWIDICK
ncbi:MAG: YbaK/EbsC family protein [Eubacteriales bacterium]